MLRQQVFFFFFHSLDVRASENLSPSQVFQSGPRKIVKNRQSLKGNCKFLSVILLQSVCSIALLYYSAFLFFFYHFLFWRYLNSSITGFLSEILLPFPNSNGLKNRVVLIKVNISTLVAVSFFLTDLIFIVSFSVCPWGPITLEFTLDLGLCLLILECLLMTRNFKMWLFDENLIKLN